MHTFSSYFFFPSEARVGLHHFPSQQDVRASAVLRIAWVHRPPRATCLKCFHIPVGTLCSSLPGLLTVLPKTVLYICRPLLMLFGQQGINFTHSFIKSYGSHKPELKYFLFQETSIFLLIRIDYCFLSVPHCWPVTCSSITYVGFSHSCFYPVNLFTCPCAHSTVLESFIPGTV